MKAWDKKLRASIMEAMELENAKLEEEMRECEPHVFSASFESRMEEVMRVQKRKSKRSAFIRFAAAAAMVVLLVGGVVSISSEQLRASALSIDIKAWLDKFFTVEDDSSGRRDEEVLFDKSQLGYIPEGFELVYEEELFKCVRYKYQNEDGKYFVVFVSSDKGMVNVDNEEVQTEVKVNASGYEYSLVYREEENDAVIMWKTQESVYYVIMGSVESEELIKIMDDISY